MKVSIDEVYYIAKLSKLKFTEEEATKFAEEFEEILDSFHSLNKYSLDDVDLHSISENASSVLRKDEAREFEDKKQLFRNVKTMRETYIQVPKILD